MKFAICNETYQDWSLEDTCRQVAETGYDGLEIAPCTQRRPTGDIRETLNKSGGPFRNTDLKSWAALAFRQTGRLHLTTEDPPGGRIRSPSVDTWREFARLWKAPMVWGSPTKRPARRLEVRGCQRADHEILHEVAETAHEGGVTIAMNLGPGGNRFLNTAEEAVRLIRQVDHPALRLHLGVKAMSDEEKDIPTIIRESQSDLAHSMPTTRICADRVSGKSISPLLPRP